MLKIAGGYAEILFSNMVNTKITAKDLLSQARKDFKNQVPPFALSRKSLVNKEVVLAPRANGKKYEDRDVIAMSWGRKAGGLIYYTLRIDSQAYLVKPISKKPRSEAAKSRPERGGTVWFQCLGLADGGTWSKSPVAWTKNTSAARKAMSMPKSKGRAPKPRRNPYEDGLCDSDEDFEAESSNDDEKDSDFQNTSQIHRRCRSQRAAAQKPKQYAVSSEPDIELPAQVMSNASEALRSVELKRSDVGPDCLATDAVQGAETNDGSAGLCGKRKTLRRGINLPPSGFNASQGFYTTEAKCKPNEVNEGLDDFDKDQLLDGGNRDEQAINDPAMLSPKHRSCRRRLLEDENDNHKHNNEDESEAPVAKRPRIDAYSSIETNILVPSLSSEVDSLHLGARDPATDAFRPTEARQAEKKYSPSTSHGAQEIGLADLAHISDVNTSTLPVNASDANVPSLPGYGRSLTSSPLLHGRDPVEEFVYKASVASLNRVEDAFSSQAVNLAQAQKSSQSLRSLSQGESISFPKPTHGVEKSTMAEGRHTTISNIPSSQPTDPSPPTLGHCPSGSAYQSRGNTAGNPEHRQIPAGGSMLHSPPQSTVRTPTPSSQISETPAIGTPVKWQTDIVDQIMARQARMPESNTYQHQPAQLGSQATVKKEHQEQDRQSQASSPPKLQSQWSIPRGQLIVLSDDEDQQQDIVPCFAKQQIKARATVPVKHDARPQGTPSADYPRPQIPAENKPASRLHPQTSPAYAHLPKQSPQAQRNQALPDQKYAGPQQQQQTRPGQQSLSQDQNTGARPGAAAQPAQQKNQHAPPEHAPPPLHQQQQQQQQTIPHQQPTPAPHNTNARLPTKPPAPRTTTTTPIPIPPNLATAITLKYHHTTGAAISIQLSLLTFPHGHRLGVVTLFAYLDHTMGVQPPWQIQVINMKIWAVDREGRGCWKERFWIARVDGEALGEFVGVCTGVVGGGMGIRGREVERDCEVGLFMWLGRGMEGGWGQQQQQRQGSGVARVR